MASSEDAQVGWQIYIEGNFALSLHDINEELIRRGFAPVSQRMFRHYRKLQRYGYTTYLPINQLDVKTLKNPLWDRATRSRYFLRETFVQVEIRILSEDTLHQFDGEATHLSEGEIAVRLSGKTALEFFDRLKKVDQLAEIAFRESGEIRLAQIAHLTADPKTGVVTLRLNFERLSFVDRLVGKQPLEVAELSAKLGGEGEAVPLASVVQRLYWLLQALEGARVACEEILVGLDESQSFSLPSPRVRKMSLESPFLAELIGSWPYILIVIVILERYAKFRKEWFEGSVAKETSRKLKWERAQREAKSKIDASELRRLAQEVMAERIESAGLNIRVNADIDTERVDNILRKHVLSSVSELVEETDGSVELKSDREVPNPEDAG